ncbi:MAG: hypothetical protein B6U69_00150 [Thermofilum sp. ex4484_15]|nr:MAG: hypothetical protein B6U69_00150 [Thermofilum sp. ex4484_15]
MVVIREEDFIRLLKYALAFCEERCPEGRDPEACYVLAESLKALKLKPPPCIIDFGGFSKTVFIKIIEDIERRRGKPIEEALEEIRKNGYRSLQDQIDEIDGHFALKLKEIYERRKGEVLKEVEA